MSRFISPMFARDPFFNPFYTASPIATLLDTSFFDDGLVTTNNNTSNNNSSNTNDSRVSNRRRRQVAQPGNVSLLNPFSSFFATPSLHGPDMKVDMFTTPTDYTVHASCPGIDKKDINITVEDRVLNIQAERKQVKKEVRSLPGTSNKSITGGQQKQIQQQQQQSNQQQQHPQEERKQGPSSSPNAKDNVMNDSKTNETSSSPNTSQNKTDSSNSAMEEDIGQYDYIESTYGHVERSFTLPDDAQLDKLTAKYEDGVIKITIPRAQQNKPEKQRIQLQ